MRGERMGHLGDAASVTVAGAMRAYYGGTGLMRRLVAAAGRDPRWDGTAAEVSSRAARRAG